MLKQLTKISKLHKTELRLIKNLVDFSGNIDKYKAKFYWNVLEDRQTNEFNDFFYYLDGNLIGYLALFTFKQDEAELSAIVHPKYRQRGIFKALLQEAAFELQKRHIANALCICPQGSGFLSDYLQAKNGQYIYSQMEMTAKNNPIAKELPEVSLTLAGKDDVVQLAKIGSDSFGSPFMEVLQRFIENARDKNRKAWLVSFNGEVIGKIHVRYENNQTAFIHDLCILPEKRGKYYGMAMILQTMQLIYNEGYKTITLDVEYHNTGALKLYDQCGFVTTAGYDFWQVPTAYLAI